MCEHVTERDNIKVFGTWESRVDVLFEKLQPIDNDVLFDRVFSHRILSR